MKNIFLLLLSLFISGCSVKESRVSKSIPYNYNHSLLGKIRYERVLQKKAKIDKTDAIKIANRSCKEQLNRVKLTYQNGTLFYRLKGKSCYLEIDAIDGSIIKMENG